MYYITYMDFNIVQFALWAQKMNDIRTSEGMELSHLIILTNILKREELNEEPLNVMWLQKEFNMSFTKIKDRLEFLEKKKLIKKTSSKLDKRVKHLGITAAGRSFTHKIILKITDSLN